MTIQEALREAYEVCTECKLVNDCVEAECRWHHIIKALEKQIPKKPTHIDKNGKFDGNWIKACPVCGMKFVERFTTEDMSYPRVYHKAKYCECGQAIDWSDTE